jgi:CIC family chloride channel protein
VHQLFPTLTSVPQAYALVGMGAMVAGVTHAPISAVLILFEMTDDYDVILPMMLAAVLSTAVCSHLLQDSIYTLKLRRKGVQLHEGRDQSLLSALKVGDAMRDPEVVLPENTPFRKVVQRVTGSSGYTYAVVDRDQKLTGFITLHDLRESMLVQELGDLVIAKELAREIKPQLQPDDSLLVAFEAFGESGIHELPVVDPVDPKRLLGVLARSAAMDVYQQALRRRS